MRCKDIIAVDRLFTLATALVATFFLIASAAVAGEVSGGDEWAEKPFGSAASQAFDTAGPNLAGFRAKISMTQRF